MEAHRGRMLLTVTAAAPRVIMAPAIQATPAVVSTIGTSKATISRELTVMETSGVATDRPINFFYYIYVFKIYCPLYSNSF